jgi:hypothetical protein
VGRCFIWEHFMWGKKVKVKVTLVQALRPCTGRRAHVGRRGIALPFLDHGTRKGLEVSVMLLPLFTPGKDPVSIVQEAGWAPGPVWTGAENLALTGIRSPDRATRSQSLYRLSYCSPLMWWGTSTLFVWYFWQNLKCLSFAKKDLCLGTSCIWNTEYYWNNSYLPQAATAFFVVEVWNLGRES